MMSDNFLYQLREQPDSEFNTNLFQKLSRIQSEPQKLVNADLFSFSRMKTMLILIGLLAISLVTIIIFTPVRALVPALIQNIAGQSFEVTDDYPGDNYPGGEEIIEPQEMSLAAALTIFPHAINLPDDIPSDYVLNEDMVHVYVGEEAGPFANTIELEWLSNNKVVLILRVTDQDREMTREVVAHGVIEKIWLNNNHPAVLIQGGWNADDKLWTNDVGVRLRWSVDDLTYELAGKSDEQLIEIAASTLHK